MSIVLDPESDLLLRRISLETGESPEDAVKHALRERFERLGSPERNEAIRAIREIQDRVAALPRLHLRDDDEVLGYNEHGRFD